jgi:hypothetical protein
MAYTKYSLTPASNNAAPPDGAPEGMLPSGVNDTMRDMMAQIRDCGDGLRDGTYTMTAVKITGGTINGTTIGATTAAAVTATTMTGTTITGSVAVKSPYFDATTSAGGAARNASGTSQIQWGAGGGDNVTVEVNANFSGSATFAKRAVGTVDGLTDGATITPDFAEANNFSVTLGGNRTLANPSNLSAGQSGVIVITQDGTGSRTLAYGSYFKFAGGTAPTLTTTAAAVDVLAYYVESSTRITAKLISDVK